MLHLQRVFTPLRALLAMTFVALLVLQVFSLPGQFAHMAEESPADAGLRWPLTVFAAVELLCVQVVIVCTWRLLGMVRDDRIFSERSLAWVNGIVRALVTAWLLLLAGSAYVLSQADDPGTGVLVAVLLLVGAVLALLMVVMRALLLQAIALRTDMEAVI